MVELNLDFDKLVAELEVNSKSPEFTSTLTGSFQSYFRGTGMEFDSFRSYVPTDDAKKIDWLASSKTDGDLLVRELIEEKGLQFMVLIDTSYGMFFTSADKLKCEVAAEIAANITFSVIEGNNKIGVGIFSDGIKEFISPETGKVHFQKILSKLKNEDLYGGEKNYSKTFRDLIDKTQEKLILIIISDFLNLSDSDEEYLKLFIKNFQVTGIMLRDPIESRLPKNAGMLCVEDINTTRQIIVNSDEVADEYNEIMEEDELRIEKIFQENGFDFLKIYTNENIVSKLMGFFLSR